MLKKSILATLFLATAAFCADFSGEHVGTFATEDGATTGGVRNVIKKATDGYDCEFFVIINGNEIPTKNPTCKVVDAKFKAEYDVDVEDTKLHVFFDADIADDKTMKGTFKSVSPDGNQASAGTWTTSPKT